jgi:glutathione S-transferase
MKLYAYRYCPFSRRVRIALAEKGIAFDYVELEPTAPHPPEIAGKTPSPHGVPVLLVRNDLVLFDSTAIVRWLDGAYPHSLTPSALDQIALADGWAGWAPAKLYAPLHELQQGNDAKKSEAKKKLVEALRSAEGIIPASGWLVASMFSRADIAMAPALAILPPDVVSELPEKVRGYIERVKARDSVREICELDTLESRPSWAA